MQRGAASHSLTGCLFYFIVLKVVQGLGASPLYYSLPPVGDKDTLAFPHRLENVENTENTSNKAGLLCTLLVRTFKVGACECFSA